MRTEDGQLSASQLSLLLRRKFSGKEKGPERLKFFFFSSFFLSRRSEESETD